MCPRRAKRSNSLREITPKGLNVNKYDIDIINKIQQVIHFNSYNQEFSSKLLDIYGKLGQSAGCDIPF
ncbi:MAG: hypothetical protein DRR08_05440 [Candidatus Parabeggiatoa sp. nov. 2]|nr:MAG: hypothetical protein B6247_15795 [Beggiatoa sp. 4572_84]RKZ62660.1 MAG: hypothetical protein DRR08_05440 [Gammaproteobacteria bacterium]